MAATDLEKLVVQLSADFKSFEKGMARASDVSNKQFNAIERRARQMNKNLDGIGKQAARSIIAPLAGIGAALGARELIKLTDTWTDLTSRVNIAAGSMEAGTEVMGRLGEMARRTYSSLEQTVESYVANSTALKELGYTTSQQLDYTEALNNALVISAAKGQRAAQIQDALAKAMAGGKLSGQELNTVIQSGGRVAEALAKGLGVGVNQLRALGAAGKITSRDVFKALTSQMETLRKEAESMPATISDGIQLLRNALLEYVGNADSAAGISAKISEALVIIADNFDTVADAGLRVAAVFAAGLLGRSVANMVRTLGLGSMALVNFTRALTAARSMASLSVAFGGLAAAAGPAGIIIGAGLATALVVAQANAQATEERTARLNTEFERLGLKGKTAAEGVDETSEALDKAADEKRVQTLKDINDELDRMRGSGSWNPLASWFADAEDQAKELGAIVRLAGNSLASPVVGGADRAAYQQIMQLAAAVRDGQVAIKDATAAAQELGRTDISEPVKKLNEELIRSLEYAGNLRSAGFANGDTTDLDAISASLEDIRVRMDGVAEADFITAEQHRQLSQVIDDLEETGEVSDETKRILASLANVQFASAIVGEINAIIPRMQALAAEAAAAGFAIRAALTLTPEQGLFDRGSRLEAHTQRVAGDAWEKEQLRRAQLGKSQLALENEIARVKKQSADDGIRITDNQAQRIAEANLSGNASRSSEGKKGGGKKERADEYERLAQRITESTAALVAETEVQRQLNPLVDDYGFAVEKARVEQELLTAAKKAGVEVTPKLRAEISNLAEQYAFATVEAAKLSESHDEIRRMAEEALGVAKDVTRGLIDGLIEGKSAADILADSLKKVGDALLNDVLNNIFKINNAGGGGGFLSMLLGGLGGLGGGVNYGALSASGKYLFDTGGYTGPGGKHQPAGVVHKGEVVWSQADVARAGGVGAVEAMRRGMSGYANGGPVALQAPVMPRLQSRSAAPSASQPVTISIDVSGARGNSEIMDMVSAGVQTGLRQYDREIAPGTINRVIHDPHARG